MNKLFSSSIATSVLLSMTLNSCDIPQNTETVDIVAPTTRAEMDAGCEFYDNILTFVDTNHFNGITTTSQTEIAMGAYQGILKYTFSNIGVDKITNKPDNTIISFFNQGTDNKKPEITADYLNKAQVASLKVGDETITFSAPATLNSYSDHCSYLNNAVLKIAEKTDISIHNLYEFAIKGALYASRDPHTIYLNEEESKTAIADTEGEFGGLGIEVIMEKGLIRIKSPMEEMPAYKAGLQDGDLITKINGRPVLGQTMNQAINQLRGLIGEPVTLTIKRDDQTPFDIKMTREKVIVHAVKNEIIGERHDVAYFKLIDFTDRITDDLIKALKETQKKSLKNGNPIKKIIIDVSQNHGGNLAQALEIIDLFIKSQPEEQKKIFATGKTPAENAIYADTIIQGNISDIFPDAAVIVIQDQKSASASEITAAALQDDGAIVIGTRSYGKGSVQNWVSMDARGKRAFSREATKGILAVTTDLFFAGAKELSNQGSGVLPDTLVERHDVLGDRAKNIKFEESLGKALISSDKTRAGRIPDTLCSLKKEFSGALSETQIEKIPAYLIQNYTIKSETTGKWEESKVLDASLDCATDGKYTNTTPYMPPALTN